MPRTAKVVTLRPELKVCRPRTARPRAIKATHVNLTPEVRAAWTALMGEITVIDRFVRGMAVPVSMQRELKKRLKRAALALAAVGGAGL